MLSPLFHQPYSRKRLSDNAVNAYDFFESFFSFFRGLALGAKPVKLQAMAFHLEVRLAFYLGFNGLHQTFHIKYSAHSRHIK